MAKLEECVRSIELDGLVWGQCKSALLLLKDLVHHQTENGTKVYVVKNKVSVYSR